MHFKCDWGNSCAKKEFSQHKERIFLALPLLGKRVCAIIKQGFFQHKGRKKLFSTRVSPVMFRMYLKGANFSHL